MLARENGHDRIGVEHNEVEIVAHVGGVGEAAVGRSVANVAFDSVIMTLADVNPHLGWGSAKRGLTLQAGADEVTPAPAAGKR